MTSKTITHVLRIGTRRVRATLTEAPDTVYLSLSGSKLRPRETRKFLRWLAPILAPFESDHRPLEISGEHVNHTTRVGYVAPGVACALEMQNESVGPDS